MFPIQFGYCVPVFAAPGARLFRTPNYARLDPAATMAISQEADALGYDSLWVADHLMLGHENAILEGWTTLAALAGATRRARLGMIHQAHFFRHPALVAKMVATVDQISGGRFIYFTDPAIGRAEHLAYGLPYPESAEERIACTVEGLEVALALWRSAEPVSYTGAHYQIENATFTPLPHQQPHPPIWFGEAHPLTLQACARYGQGWNSVPVSPAEMEVRIAALGAACAAEGRTLAEIEISLETQIHVVPNQAALRHSLQAMAALSPNVVPDPALRAYLDGEAESLPPALADRYLLGTPDQVATQLQQYIDLGVTHFLLWFMDAPAADGLRLFASEVMPRFR